MPNLDPNISMRPSFMCPSSASKWPRSKLGKECNNMLSSTDPHMRNFFSHESKATLAISGPRHPFQGQCEMPQRSLSRCCCCSE